MTNFMLDTFDHALLDALLDDSSQTNADLAETVGLSASQCSRRRARLEQAGIITGYVARVDKAAMGFGMRAITRVSLSQHGEEAAQKFTSFLSRHEEVEGAYSVSGDADYVLMLRAKDLSDFANFMHKELLPQPNVTQVRSEIVLMTIK